MSIFPEQNACSDRLKVLLSKSLQRKDSLYSIATAEPQAPLSTTTKKFERMMRSENRAKQQGYSSGGYRNDYYLGAAARSAGRNSGQPSADASF